jgi:hypothetical protein
MRFKEILFESVIAIVSLLSVKYLFNGFNFSTSFSYLPMFWAVFIFCTVMATKVRIFFLLPHSYYVDVIVTAAVVAISFWLCTFVIGGATFHASVLPAVNFLGIAIQATALNTFGTIGVQAVLVGAVYQLIILLERQK